ncbi:polysaccharide biosynthesis protein [Thiolapillus brandeum]|uniref:Polysaccharide biosynthesis protein CapD n=1 Tax=Thiolapillus brandeum TaxID=1076588 RepID=A0A7U6JH25_9GAMM|nr:nucleoside-diphosphate sugar epimerase/dehydratase [Thiolapillus brandeum]BAO43417.1 polysaccharide biosynthesis protein CapD [Thiolapillus brandeum]
MKKFADRLLNRGMAFVHDLLMIPLAWLGAYVLRFNLEAVPDWFWQQALHSLLLVIPVQAVVFWLFGLYRGVWRFASLPDMIRIGKAVFSGLLSITLLLWLTRDFSGVPRSVPVLYGILLMIFLSLPRMVYRFIKDQGSRSTSAQRVLIVGAGSAGEMLARDLLRDPQRAYLPLAFVDDDPAKRGREIHGVRVQGECSKLPRIARRLAADLVMLAVPSADKGQMQRIITYVEETGLPFRTVPPLKELMSGNVRVDQLREVSIEDLLGRDPVALEWQAIRQGLAGRTVLVTGAGGSIGSELCRQLAGLGVKRLVLAENSEFNLFCIDNELRQQFPQLQIHPHLADVTDRRVMDLLFHNYRPQVVFHAAAYKHVPLLEQQLREAMRNNVLGTRNVALAADRWEAEEFVLISTDKAVNPANIMGASKRAAEIYCQNLNDRSGTSFITVRFGNVLGSTGSVVPLFKEQIKKGGPVRVTHPDIERYFMTTREACQLIMQASVLGQGGEIFVLDMGQPVRIQYLAEQLIRLSGKKPGEDIAIEYIGLRPGEKLYEELFHEQESLQPTAHEKILQARYRPVKWERLSAIMEDTEKACASHDCDSLSELLNQLVPERVTRGNGRECALQDME